MRMNDPVRVLRNDPRYYMTVAELATHFQVTIVIMTGWLKILQSEDKVEPFNRAHRNSTCWRAVDKSKENYDNE